jgi:hypothetical protein
MMAMLSECTADVFVQACFNMPTLGGLYKSATTDALLRKGGTRAALTALVEA